MRVLKCTLDEDDRTDVRVAAGLTQDEADEMAARLNAHASTSDVYYLVADEEYDIAESSTRRVLEIVLGSARVTARARA